jgi:thiamine biosynthesis lipoprotein
MIDKKSLNRIISRRSFIQLVAVAGTTAACWQLGFFGKKLHLAQRSQPIMGTVLNLSVYGPDRDTCEEALQNTIVTMQALERKLSRHMRDSELAQLNRVGRLENPSTDLLNVITLASELNRRSSGGFDVTVLPLLRLYEDNKTTGMSSPATDQTAKQQLVDFTKVNFNSEGINFDSDGMEISLDGVGKGYIVDRGVEALRSYGFNNVLVDAGGDMMVSGQKNGNTPWRIGLRNPRPEAAQKMVTFPVSNKAVATSGDYLQAFSPDLKNHHIIDPRSGFSPPELASVTVTAPNVALADGLATAVMVLGPADGIELIESMDGCEAYLVGKDLQNYNSTSFFS